MASERSLPRQLALRRPGSLGTGLLVLVCLATAGLVASWFLDLSWRGLLPGRGGLLLAGEFLGEFWRPALRFQGEYAPTEFWALPQQVLKAMFMTVVFAAAAVSLAIPGGLVLGFLGSTAWWANKRQQRRVWLLVTAAARILTTLMRSVHELVWAVLLLAALGRGNLVAVVAIAIPYAGTLAKVFGEMIDETSPAAADALGEAGATSLQRFGFALLPAALPDLLAYTFYRFECGLRSAAVLGFFGFPTLGYYIAASFENLHYGEVWTYLYALFALILVVDWWSGRLRREVQA